MTKYDVALSFLSKDVGIARELYQLLAERLTVFMYERNQEEIAGTDGLESFRAVFRENSLLNVVLFSDEYGQTPWTRVEVTAIQERALRDGWHTVLLVSVKRNTPPPKWSPQQRIHSSWEDFGSKGVAAVILARAKEAGAPDRKETPAELAARLALAEQDVTRRRGVQSSERGLREAEAEVSHLFGALEKHLHDTAAATQWPVKIGRKVDQIAAHLRNHSISVHWSTSYSNSLKQAGLYVYLFNGYLQLPGDPYPPGGQPTKVETAEFEAFLAASDRWTWRQMPTKVEYSSDDLAEEWIAHLVRLVAGQGGA